jgi:protein-S-isoprenylcysteine O-methyltransferase Ste14
VRFLFSLGVWGGLLFLAAGTLSWTRGWVHVGLWIVTLATNLVILLWTNPDVVAARMKRQQAGAKFEKVMLPLFVPVMLAIPVVAGLDAVRYAWTFLPLWARWPGVIVHVAGDAFMLWAMIVNPYLAPEVRIQTERGHRVITTGPYAIVRHPMYVGLILGLAGIPLLLGSSWAFLPVGVVALLLVIRMVFEDRMLRKELPGYEAYMLKAPHRLIPGVW